MKVSKLSSLAAVALSALSSAASSLTGSKFLVVFAVDPGGYVTGEVDIGVFSSWKCRGLLVVLSDISLVFKNSLIVPGFGLKAGGHQRAASQI